MQIQAGNRQRLRPKDKVERQMPVIRVRQTFQLATVFCLLLAPLATLAQGASKRADQKSGAQVQVPNRPISPLFNSTQGKQKTEIRFDPATGMVTLKLLVQDPNGYFIPNLRRDNFVVYEDGVKQQNATVDIEHAPVTLAALMEFGGRAPGLNRQMGDEVTRAAQRLLDELGPEDKVTFWKYSDQVQKLADANQSRDAVKTELVTMGTRAVSETNLYDAVIATVAEMRPVSGRKAIVLITSGIDTFSKAHYEDARKAAEESDSPIYVLSLTQVLRQILQMQDRPLATIDWNQVEHQLQETARVSGGRAYTPSDTSQLSPVYDDVMENLKVRYVITYKSNNRDANSQRTVRVELVDTQTGGPLVIRDANGRIVRASVILQENYVPSPATSH
jgi:Ca-activated chloride channel family protein